jgi:hypothetical protein
MLDAIAQRVEQDEQEAAFHLLADARWDNLLATGNTVGWDDAKAWLEARSRGEHPERPSPRAFER